MRTVVPVVLVMMFVAGGAWAQMSLTPRSVRVDSLTCGELLSLPAEQRDRLLIYFNGYLDGRQQATTWDERLTGERIDRVVAQCKSKPEEAVLRVFIDEWSR